MPAHRFGLEQVIEIGPMGGRSNVVFWLEKHGLAGDDVVDRIFAAAKQSARILAEDEILALAGASAKHRASP